MKRNTLIAISLSIIAILIILTFTIKNQDTNQQLPLTYNEVFKEKLFDIKVDVSPLPNLSSTSDVTLFITPLKRDSNLIINFTDHPYFNITSEDTFEFNAKLGEETTIGTKIYFNSRIF